MAELARRFPESVLVRDSMKAFVSRNDDIETIHDKSRIIQAGEVLILVGEVLGVKGKNQTRYLRLDVSTVHSPTNPNFFLWSEYFKLQHQLPQLIFTGIPTNSKTVKTTFFVFAKNFILKFLDAIRCC